MSTRSSTTTPLKIPHSSDSNIQNKTSKTNHKETASSSSSSLSNVVGQSVATQQEESVMEELTVFIELGHDVIALILDYVLDGAQMNLLSIAVYALILEMS